MWWYFRKWRRDGTWEGIEEAPRPRVREAEGRDGTPGAAIIDSHSFEVLPCRWVVERTLAWLGRCRRLSKDYEELPETSEAWVHAAMIHLMLKRLSTA